MRISDVQQNGEAISAALDIFRTRYPAFAARVADAAPVDTGHDPAESATFAAQYEAPEWGCAVFIGGGPHVPAIMRKCPERTLFLIYEPEPGVWKAMLEGAEDWVAKTNWRLIDTHSDEQQFYRALNAAGFVPALGFKVISTRPNDARLKDTILELCETAASAIRNWRLDMVSTLTLPEKTQRNALANIKKYVESEGLAPLEMKHKGVPGITVAAGPSLARNIKHLAREHVRESFILCCVQTALKPLLAAGIRPHFVCALDFAPISRQFYEGLTAETVAGIELVALSAASPAILEAWPGEVRFASDGFLDGILGDDRGWRGQLPPASSVGHMSYNFLRYIGCDPVILVGQDLAYTDGVYYGAGAAIHEQWSCELGPFNTLETMETDRCRRGGDSLVWRLDSEGRPIRTDLQLDGYRVRFEMQFAEDVGAGFKVINATEGGQVLKHTEPMPLSKVIDQYVGVPA